MEITRSQVVTIEDPRHHKWTVCASICPYTYPNLWVFVESFQLFPNRQALCITLCQEETDLKFGHLEIDLSR